MKSIILFVAVAIVSAFAEDSAPPVQIINHENVVNEDGSYHYSYESADGSKASQSGSLKKIDEETSVGVASGEYSYTGDDGNVYSIKYIADENGYQPTGDHIPQVPAPIARALAYLATLPPPTDAKKL